MEDLETCADGSVWRRLDDGRIRKIRIAPSGVEIDVTPVSEEDVKRANEVLNLSRYANEDFDTLLEIGRRLGHVNTGMTLSPEIYEGCRRKFRRFEEQYTAVVSALQSKAVEFHIAVIALYGSVLTGVGPYSDVDILVLLTAGPHTTGTKFLDLRDDIRDYAEEHTVNDIPLDLHIVSAESFLDITHGTAFKQSFSENNKVMWEDGVTIDRRYFAGS